MGRATSTRTTTPAAGSSRTTARPRSPTACTTRRRSTGTKPKWPNACAGCGSGLTMAADDRLRFEVVAALLRRDSDGADPGDALAERLGELLPGRVEIDRSFGVTRRRRRVRAMVVRFDDRWFRLRRG